MDPTIKRTKAGGWSFVVDIPRGPDGKRQQKRVTVAGTRREAEQKKAEMLNAINEGTYSKSGKMKVGDYLDRWLSDCATPRLSPNSLARYSEVLKKHVHADIRGTRLSALQPMSLQSLYARWQEAGYAPKTIHLYHFVLRAAFGQAVRWKLLAHNPVDFVDPPRLDGVRRSVMNDDGIADLIEKVRGHRLETAIILAATTGMRRGEICALLWSSVDLDKGLLVVERSAYWSGGETAYKEPKTKSGSRPIALPPMTVDALRDALLLQEGASKQWGAAYAGEGFVVCREDGSPFSPPSLSMACNRLLRELAPGTTMHGLRHNHASHLMRQGVAPSVAAQMLGHSNISTTLSIYTHVLPEQHVEAARKVGESLARRQP